MLDADAAGKLIVVPVISVMHIVRKKNPMTKYCRPESLS